MYETRSPYRSGSGVDFLVLGCDGIFEVFSDETLIEFVAERIKVSENTAALAEDVVKAAYDRGSGDNLTAIVLVLAQDPLAEIYAKAALKGPDSLVLMPNSS